MGRGRRQAEEYGLDTLGERPMRGVGLTPITASAILYGKPVRAEGGPSKDLMRAIRPEKRYGQEGGYSRR